MEVFSTCPCMKSFKYLHSTGPPEDTEDLWLAPTTYNGTLFGPMGRRPSTSNPAWFIAQWSNPIPLDPEGAIFDCPQASCPCTSLDNPVSWYISNQNSRVCLHNGTSSHSRPIVELYSTGSTNLLCGTEKDLFLSPVGGIYGRYPQAGPGSSGNPPTLADLTCLKLSFNSSLVYSNVTSRCGTCGSSLDYSYATAGVTLTNSRLGPQTLFYQILLWDSRYNQTSCLENPCQPKGNRFYFTTFPTYGVNFNIGYFNASCLMPQSPPVWTYYTLDLLPSMLIAINTSKYGIDGNASHWTVGGMYIGVGLQGDAALTLLLSDINLVGHM